MCYRMENMCVIMKNMCISLWPECMLPKRVILLAEEKSQITKQLNTDLYRKDTWYRLSLKFIDYG